MSDAPRRGRPRPQDTIARDNQVTSTLQQAVAPLTRNDIASALGITSEAAYLSLHRLRQAGQVKRSRREDGQHVWQATT